MNSYNSGESFIDHIYQELINTEEVKKAIQRKGVNPNNREEAVRYYMERMQHAHNTQRKIDILKRFYYKKYVIDHLPESYVERQWRIAREQGHGNIRITDEIKRKMLEDIQSEQRKSIDRWLDYLNSADAMYPMWFKYYAFQGMIKLGKFDKEKKKFGKRTKDTTNPFIEVNPEILGQMYTILSKMIEKQELTEEEIKTLEKGESFQKLYTSLLIQMEENRIVNGTGVEGKWIKYEQGNNYQELWKSLQGKNTGWCTAGEEMCRSQIKGGDFYVYYTYDKDGNPTEPRIAIRMNGQNKIAEVRGIEKEQNLESEMIEIASAKLSEFPNNEGKKYQKKVSDMKILTEIERKTNNNEELNEDELIFLYQLETDIEGFGWHEDPRVEEIIEKRNSKEDLKKLDETKIISGVQRNPRLLEYVPSDIPNYKEIALLSVREFGRVLQYVPFDTPGYEEIAMEAVKQNSYMLEYVPENLQNYKEIALLAVKKNGYVLEYVPFDVPDYGEIAIEAIRENGIALKYVSKNTSNYEEIVMEAVKHDGSALRYVSNNISNYEEVALEAIKQNSNALEFVSKNISNYELLFLKSLKNDKKSLRNFPHDFEFKRPEIALEAVRQNALALRNVSTDISNYEEIAMEAVKLNGSALKYVSNNISNYEEVALEAVRKSGMALRYVPENISNYEEVAMEAVKQNEQALAYVSEYTPNYTDIAFTALKRTYNLYQLSDELESFIYAPEALSNLESEYYDLLGWIPENLVGEVEGKLHNNLYGKSR
ncbi:MAG: DUF4116 domain-containing protein [Clostridia bacterium]|nr:DUF4116 domain-containing protein [Clostridia bacterium]